MENILVVGRPASGKSCLAIGLMEKMRALKKKPVLIEEFTWKRYLKEKEGLRTASLGGTVHIIVMPMLDGKEDYRLAEIARYLNIKTIFSVERTVLDGN